MEVVGRAALHLSSYEEVIFGFNHPPFSLYWSTWDWLVVLEVQGQDIQLVKVFLLIVVRLQDIEGQEMESELIES